MGTLADIHLRPGLPRGRGSLPPDEVRHAQRERMLRAITSAVAELGYGGVRIADVVDRARVSRQSFYAQFADKEECFLAAHTEGVQLILNSLAAWATRQSGSDQLIQLRGAIRTYLDLCAAEPEFAHCMLVQLPAIGPAGLRARLAAHGEIAALLGGWHAGARELQPAWPEVPAVRYRAAVGAVHELVFDAVTRGRVLEPDDLEDAAVDAVMALLQIPPGDAA